MFFRGDSLSSSHFFTHSLSQSLSPSVTFLLYFLPIQCNKSLFVQILFSIKFYKDYLWHSPTTTLISCKCYLNVFHISSFSVNSIVLYQVYPPYKTFYHQFNQPMKYTLSSNQDVFLSYLICILMYAMISVCLIDTLLFELSQECASAKLMNYN